MNEITRYELKKFISFVQTDLLICREPGNGTEPVGHTPLTVSLELREKLTEGAKGQEIPYIMKDGFQVCFSCIYNRKDQEYVLIGPLMSAQLEINELHKFYKQYGMEKKDERQLKRYTLHNVVNIISLAASLVTGQKYDDQELMDRNGIGLKSAEDEQKEKILFNIRKEEEELYHHTYQEELKTLSCIREGRTQEALEMSRKLDVMMGRLSGKEVNHWRNAAMVSVTLITRAAIEGGVSPSLAYRLSDFYIQKIDEGKNVAEILKYRDRALEELTEQVQKKKERKYSGYVERCKDYIDRHYREKIHLSEVAEKLGLSVSYLSRLFRKETGMNFQNYLKDSRLEHAANLLKYSQETISDIAEYVNFPSQSYMGSLFKEKYGVSPGKYREQNRPADFFRSGEE